MSAATDLYLSVAHLSQNISQQEKIICFNFKIFANNLF
jgi:hypothetical protein